VRGLNFRNLIFPQHFLSESSFTDVVPQTASVFYFQMGALLAIRAEKRFVKQNARFVTKSFSPG